MVIGQTQCFMIALLFAAAQGARRGWGREVITCAIILATVLFLSNGGIDFLLNAFTNLSANTNGTALAFNAASCSAATKQLLSTGGFGLMSWLAYSVGYRYGTAPRSHNHRIAGIIPGAFNGAAIAYYLSNTLVPNGRQLELFTPTSQQTTAYLPEIFGLGLVGLLVVLFIAGQAGKTGK